jgi:hypothetical protein
MAQKRGTRVWVVMRYEIFHGEVVDSVEFHVASSLKAAERYMKQVHVAPYSWWQVHPYVVDHDLKRDGWEGEDVYYYSHTGRPLKAVPTRRAISAFQRAQQAEARNAAKRK